MVSTWPDIPGVTAVSGRPRLPRSPDVAIHALSAALDGSIDGITLPALVDKVARETRTERARAEGLAGWLPLWSLVTLLAAPLLVRAARSGSVEGTAQTHLVFGLLYVASLWLPG